jgi:hypothetical protein
VLRRDRPRAALSRALAECDRLVLLGDTLELRHGPMREALEAAEPVVRELAGALAPGAEVVIVPGNHDHRLLRGWLERRAGEPAPQPLGLDAPVDWRDGEPLATLAGWLAPAGVRASYPGVWLRDDVYATHGHYGDVHTTVPLLERLGAGLMMRLSGASNGRPRRAEDYEAVLAPMYVWIDTVAQAGGVRGRGGGGLQVRAWHSLQRNGPGRSIRGTGIALAFPAAVAVLNRAGFGPFDADVSGPELRRAALRAFDQVVRGLGVEAATVISGHTHRAGPLAGDEPAEWTAADGASLLNTGSWVYERGFLGPSPAESPYRPGFSAVLEDDGPPSLINLLDQA